MAFKIALVFHLLGICNWFGAAGAQVFLLSSYKKGKDKEYEAWADKMAAAVTKSIELPGMLLAFLAGGALLFLGPLGLHIFSQHWFIKKLILVFCLALQTFYELSATGKIVRMREEKENEENLNIFKKKYLLWGKAVTFIALGAFYFAVYKI